ncbi:MAG: biotin transport system substrate-specific component [Pseudohongiellaceae bacterium]|jgi:biotin transport system substrate-specific component
MQSALLVVLFSFSMFLGTIVEFPIPGTTIMQTGQTIAVLCAGALVGVKLGAASVMLYLLFGFLGLPVFSEGASGLQVLAGPSGGYLVGFVAAAAAMGGWRRAGLMRSPIMAMLGMLLGHAIILVCGWLWMTMLIGALAAYTNGIAPFYLGALVKSALAALLVLLIRRAAQSRRKKVSAP